MGLFRLIFLGFFWRWLGYCFEITRDVSDYDDFVTADVRVCGGRISRAAQTASWRSSRGGWPVISGSPYCRLACVGDHTPLLRRIRKQASTQNRHRKSTLKPYLGLP